MQKVLKVISSKVTPEALWIASPAYGGQNSVKGSLHWILIDLHLTDVWYLINKWTGFIGGNILISKVVTEK